MLTPQQMGSPSRRLASSPSGGPLSKTGGGIAAYLVASLQTSRKGPLKPRQRPDPEVDQATRALERLLAQFTDEEIDTGVIARDTTAAAPTERHTSTTLHELLATARFERSLAQLLRSAREASGLSVAETAKRIGVPRSRVLELERSGADIGLTTLQRHASTLGYDLQIVFIPRDDDGPPLLAHANQPHLPSNGTEHD